MVYKISDIKLPIGYNSDDVKSAVADVVFTSKDNVNKIKLLKTSLDARRKGNLFYIVTVACEFFSDKSIDKSKCVEYIEEPDRISKLNLPYKKSEKVVYVIGSGPSGLFSALTLATFGIKVIVVERGSEVDKRTKDVEEMMKFGKLNPSSNIQFGEGGAGTFSDGKLNTGTNSVYHKIVLGEFIDSGAPEDICYSNRPHIGTDYLKKVVKNMRKKIISLGGEFMFDTCLTDIIVDNGTLKGIKLNGITQDAENIVLAIGHSARDTYKMLLNNGVAIEPKPFSMGVRIEHLQEKINVSQYGKNDDSLPPADYKLSTHLQNGRGVYTFCMCPGGYVVPATSEENSIVTNGMSNYARNNQNANSAVLVSVSPSDFGSDDILAGVEFQRKYERKAYKLSESYNAPIQKLGDFLNDRISTCFGEVKPSYQPDTAFANLKDCLPDFVVSSLKDGIRLFDNKLRGFANPDAIMTGVETRSSSPVRLLRNEHAESNVSGVFLTGEGAGYAGGITSSASDGISTAIKLLDIL